MMQAELKSQKEELQRQRVVLQRQIDLFDEYKSRSWRDLVSAGATTRTLPATTNTAVLHHRSASDDADQHHHVMMSDDGKYCLHSYTPPWSSSDVGARTQRGQVITSLFTGGAGTICPSVWRAKFGENNQDNHTYSVTLCSRLMYFFRKNVHTVYSGVWGKTLHKLGNFKEFLC